MRGVIYGPHCVHEILVVQRYLVRKSKRNCMLYLLNPASQLAGVRDVGSDAVLRAGWLTGGGGGEGDAACLSAVIGRDHGTLTAMLSLLRYVPPHSLAASCPPPPMQNLLIGVWFNINLESLPSLCLTLMSHLILQNADSPCECSSGRFMLGAGLDEGLVTRRYPRKAPMAPSTSACSSFRAPVAINTSLIQS